MQILLHLTEFECISEAAVNSYVLLITFADNNGSAIYLSLQA